MGNYGIVKDSTLIKNIVCFYFYTKICICQKQEWKMRKRNATDILDAILETYPKSKRILFEEIGIVLDEEAKLDIKQF